MQHTELSTTRDELNTNVISAPRPTERGVQVTEATRNTNFDRSS